MFFFNSVLAVAYAQLGLKKEAQAALGKYFQGLVDYTSIFKNPKGTPEKINEYLMVTDYGIFPYSVAK